MKKYIKLSYTCFLLFALSGCGLKGDLYRPAATTSPQVTQSISPSE